MKSWRKLFVACIAAVQLFTMIPVLAVEGASRKSGIVGSRFVEDRTEGVHDNREQKSETSSTVQPVLPGEYPKNVVVLIVDSNKIVQDGVEYTSPQPITVKKSVSYVALRSLIDRFGFTLDYDRKRKETIIKNGDKELRYKIGSFNYSVNGVPTKMKGAPYMQNNVFMVPVTSAMDALLLPYQWEKATKRIVIQLSSKPIAKFKINESTIIANETRVTFTDQSTHPLSLQIVEAEWDGQKEIYEEPGTYTITLRVRDEHGEWSDPYTQTIHVQGPHMPPVANFSTDKTTYKMGEPIHYEDLSMDTAADDAALKREWKNKEPAFFEPGEQTITLQVTNNKSGLTAEVSKTITITNETMYSFADFNQLFTPIGDMYPFDGSSALSMKELKPAVTEENCTLYRSNSPENVTGEGVLYQDRIAGGGRIFAHHINKTPYKMKFYILVRNVSDNSATLTVQHQGIAGPSKNPEETGRKGVIRYFESFSNNGRATEMTLQPNETKVMIPELNQKAFMPDQAFTLYADFNGNNELEYSVVALDADSDVYHEWPNLEFLDRDVHIRGTFDYADRILTVNEMVGHTPSRLLLGDNISDKDITGMDRVTSNDQLNRGNYGVLYHIRLNKVAPRTLISFSGRGGPYAGGMFVNGQTISTPSFGVLKNADEASVVYRTGDQEEPIEIWFSPAAGGNLPVSLVFTPLPKTL